ncbi:hypothetical protein A2U01_0103502, partial [Trifolium medium]|nr:hypothetical protein [Trifolium medium]
YFLLSALGLAGVCFGILMPPSQKTLDPVAAKICS